MDRRTLLLGGLTAAMSPSIAHSKMCERIAHARFVGRLQLERHYPLFRLMSSYEFRDGCGKRWIAPVNARTDGASIPRVAQLFVGDPYSGPYLDGAVIHDWYCVARTEPHDDVHRMFYNAMIAANVGPSLATILYAAVCWKGPKWDQLTIENSREMLRLAPHLVIDRVPSKAPPPIPPAPPPTVAEAPPPPDRALLESARRSMAAQDIAASESYLAAFEEQAARYESYQLAQRQALEDGRRFQEQQAEQLAIARRDRQNEAEQLRSIVRQAEQSRASLDEIALIATAHPDASGLSQPSDPTRNDMRVVTNPTDPIERGLDPYS